MSTLPSLGQEQQASHREYAKRINRALDYIDTHLAEKLDLDQLARVACFSPFHFHRLFSAMMGETINAYTRRRRLEIAAMRLRSSQQASITSIALECGFGTSSTFARAFRSHFGVSASEWRTQEQAASVDAKSKIGQVFRKVRTVEQLEMRQIGSTTSLARWMVQMNTPQEITAHIEIQELEQQSVAYVRHVGPYAGDSALFRRLINRIQTWGRARGLTEDQCQPIIVGHDDPMITPEDKLRISVCVRVPKDTQAVDDIGILQIPGGKYAVSTFEVSTEAIPAAWRAMKAGWLPSSGFQPDDRPCFERVLCSPPEHPHGLHKFEIYFPIRPL